MAKEQTKQAEMGGYLSAFLRKHFGKGPTSVHVTLQPPFFTVHLNGFLAPMEEILLKQQEWNRVLETRDLLFRDLQEQMMQSLGEIMGMEVAELYADWKLDKKTGLFIGILETDEPVPAIEWPEDVSEKEFIERFEEASLKAEKVPKRTEAFWLSDRTLLVRRSGILIAIEKELIKNGFEEELRLAKRPLEHKVLQSVHLETVLKRSIAEIFFDWNFEADLAYVVLTLEPRNKNIR